MPLVLALVGLGVVPAAAAADEHGLAPPPTVTQKVVLGPNDVVGFGTVRCPPGTVFPSPFWDQGKGGVLVAPTGSTSNVATFTVTRLILNSREPIEVTVGALCFTQEMKAAKDQGVPHTHDLQFKPRSQPVSIPATQFDGTTSVACPADFSAVSGSLFGDRIRATSSTPSPDGRTWNFITEKLSNAAETATARVQCVGNRTGSAKKTGKKGKKGRKHRHKIQRRTVEIDIPITTSPAPGRSLVEKGGTLSCPASFLPVGLAYSFVGHPFTSVATFLPGQVKAPKSGRSTATAAAVKDAEYLIQNGSTEQIGKLEVVCLGQKTAPDTA